MLLPTAPPAQRPHSTVSPKAMSGPSAAVWGRAFATAETQQQLLTQHLRPTAAQNNCVA